MRGIAWSLSMCSMVPSQMVKIDEAQSSCRAKLRLIKTRQTGHRKEGSHREQASLRMHLQGRQNQMLRELSVQPLPIKWDRSRLSRNLRFSINSSQRVSRRRSSSNDSLMWYSLRNSSLKWTRSDSSQDRTTCRTSTTTIIIIVTVTHGIESRHSC